MKHSLDPQSLGPAGAPMAAAVQACVHCGFCLPDCPTYRELGQEMDSPRGRILLMKGVLEGDVPMGDALPHLDRCLGCLACETACPSGVHYRDLISPFRAKAEPARKRPLAERLRRLMLLMTLPYPRRFRPAAHAAAFFKPLAPKLPASLRPMLSLSPKAVPPSERLPVVSSPQGERRARVALLAGCAQQVLAPEINRATIALLTRQGVEVVVPPDQGCCGALAWHVGDARRAAKHARQNLRAFPENIDAIITNAAGCGSGLHEYPLILAGEPEEPAARAFAATVLDVCAFLDQLGLRDPLPARKKPLRIAYQDACHLRHAQGVHAAPRRLLAAIPGAELIDPARRQHLLRLGGHLQHRPARTRRRAPMPKRGSSTGSGADVAATGNIGCLTQLHLPQRNPRRAAYRAHGAALGGIGLAGRFPPLTDRAIYSSSPSSSSSPPACPPSGSRSAWIRQKPSMPSSTVSPALRKRGGRNEKSDARGRAGRDDVAGSSVMNWLM
ncbi:MAG: heterodisulfide reductase-related iron-sulfur binding cluster [Verrucomicrobiales bacterium]